MSKEKLFFDTVCKNIDWLSAAARRGDQEYVDQYLDTLFVFNERINGRSGLEPRPSRRTPDALGQFKLAI